MIIGCQDQGTYIMSEYIVSFDIHDTDYSYTAIDAKMNGSAHLFTYRIGKFKNREAAIEYLTKLANMIQAGNVPIYLSDEE